MASGCPLERDLLVCPICGSGIRGVLRRSLAFARKPLRPAFARVAALGIRFRGALDRAPAGLAGSPIGVVARAPSIRRIAIRKLSLHGAIVPRLSRGSSA